METKAAAAGDGSGPADRRAVVTGGAGFIGSTLVDRLLHDGWTVVAVDNFDAFYGADRKRENVADALRHPRFALVDVDTRDGQAVAATFRDAAPTVVFDLAARAGLSVGNGACEKIVLRGRLEPVEYLALSRDVASSAASAVQPKVRD